MSVNEIIEKDFLIENMDCADCASHIEQIVSRIEGVRSVSINFINGRMHLSGESQALSDQSVMQAVHQAGYKAIPESVRIFPDQSGKPGDLPVQKTSSQTRHLTPLLSLAFCGILTVIGIILELWPQGNFYTIPAYLAAIMFGGAVMARKGWQELRIFKPGMNLLMTVAVLGAMVISEWTEAATVVFLFALAQYLESRSMDKARRSINALIDESPVNARLVVKDGYQQVPAETVIPGQEVAVKPGEKIPSDGIVIEGNSYVNQAAITGEPLPVAKGPEDRVYAGSLNTNGFLVIKVDKYYKDTTFLRIIHLITEAQSKKAPKQAFIERFAGYYTPAVIGLAFLVAVLPPLLFNQPFVDWFYRALVLLVISCPCALVISTPVTVVSGLTAAMRQGILIKGGLFLENFSRIKAMAFDKTGTLTEGRPAVQDIIVLGKSAEDQVLTIAASLEELSHHPIAEALTKSARSKNLVLKPVKNYRTIDGKGVEGEIDGEHFLAGNHRLFEEKGWCDENIHHVLEKVEDEKHTAVLVGNSQAVLGIISISDKVRADSKKTISGVKSAGVEKIILLTGDNHRTAEKVSKAVGITDYRAELLPEDKVQIIRELRNQNGDVAMIGDGLNDAPSLAAADIGIAIGNGSADAALDTADIVLMKDDLTKINYLWDLSRLTGRIIRQNIILALGLKFIFLALAIPGLATLWMAVIADMGASLLVIFNGLRTLR
jgi:Cd2+/Zn2+-exporting ATPase